MNGRGAYICDGDGQTCALGDWIAGRRSLPVSPTSGPPAPKIIYESNPAFQSWAAKWWTEERLKEYDRLFNPPSVYDWFLPEEGRPR